MAPLKETDALQILVQIAGEIGETRGDIASLKSNVDTITEDFKEVKNKIEQSVTKPECTQRHVVIAQSLDAMKKDILTEMKKPSGLYQAVTPKMMRDAAAPTMQEIEANLIKKKEEAIEKRRKHITFWLITISTVIALLGVCTAAVYKFVLFMDKLENVVATKSDEVRSEVRKAQNRVVYVQAPIDPDSGVSYFPKKVQAKKR